MQLDPDNPGSIINAVWWGDNEPVEATRLWAGSRGPHQYVEDVSVEGAFAGWHKPANRTATDSAPPPPSSTLAASDGQRFSESELEMLAADDTAALLAQAEQDPAHVSAMSKGLMESFTPEEWAALDRKFELSKQLRREQYEAEFPTSERQAMIDEMRALGVSERMVGRYDKPIGAVTGKGDAKSDRSRMQDDIARERAEQASLPVTAIPPHVAAEIARGIADAARNYDVQATIEAQARERMRADRRYSKSPSLRKAEREQMKRLIEEDDKLLERQDALVAQHGITDADMDILRDHANPLGRHLEDPHLRAMWRKAFYAAAPYEGVGKATKQANAEVEEYQARGGFEEEQRRQREAEKKREWRIADNRAKSEQQLAWIRQKLAAGETVGIYAMTYTGGLGGMKPSGPEITPKLYANWKASGQDLFKIGPDGRPAGGDRAASETPITRCDVQHTGGERRAAFQRERFGNGVDREGFGQGRDPGAGSRGCARGQCNTVGTPVGRYDSRPVFAGQRPSQD